MHSTAAPAALQAGGRPPHTVVTTRGCLVVQFRRSQCVAAAGRLLQGGPVQFRTRASLHCLARGSRLLQEATDRALGAGALLRTNTPRALQAEGPHTKHWQLLSHIHITASRLLQGGHIQRTGSTIQCHVHGTTYCQPARQITDSRLHGGHIQFTATCQQGSQTVTVPAGLPDNYLAQPLWRPLWEATRNKLLPTLLYKSLPAA